MSNEINSTHSLSQDKQVTKVWDAFIRSYHWLMVSGFLVNYFIIEDDHPLHNWIGYTILILIMMRIVWGFVGSEQARFINFVPTIKEFFIYVKSLFLGKEKDFIGHNPAGAYMIILLLITMTILCITGWMLTLDMFWGAIWVEDVHYYSSRVLLSLMFIHVGGVLYASLRHKKNLIKAMIVGYKD